MKFYTIAEYHKLFKTQKAELKELWEGRLQINATEQIFLLPKLRMTCLTTLNYMAEIAYQSLSMQHNFVLPMRSKSKNVEKNISIFFNLKMQKNRLLIDWWHSICIGKKNSIIQLFVAFLIAYSINDTLIVINWIWIIFAFVKMCVLL